MIKPIPGFPGYYAGEKGNIYSKKLYSDNRRYKLTPYIRKGYKRVRLRVNGVVYDKSVHFLVALTFIKGYKKGYEVNHIDKNRLNNRVENLEWLSHINNVRYSICRKLRVTDLTTGKIKIYPSCRCFAKKTGISTSNLARYYMKKKHGYIAKWHWQVEYLT